MDYLAEKFKRLGIDNAPGQETRQKTENMHYTNKTTDNLLMPLFFSVIKILADHWLWLRLY